MPSTRPTVDPVLDILEEMGYDFDELDGDGYKRSLKEAIIKLTIKDAGDSRIEPLTIELQKVKGSRKVQTKEKKTTISPAKFLTGTTFRPEDIKPADIDDSSTSSDIVPDRLKNIADSLDSIALLLRRQLGVEKKQQRDARKEQNKLNKDAREDKLEGKPKDKKTGLIPNAIKKPALNFFEKLKKFFLNVVIGMGAVKLFEWLKDPANAGKVEKFKDFLINNAGWILGGLAAIALLPVLSGIMGVLGGLKTGLLLLKPALALLFSPAGLAALALALGIGGTLFAMKFGYDKIRDFATGGKSFTAAHEALDNKLQQDIPGFKMVGDKPFVFTGSSRQRGQGKGPKRELTKEEMVKYNEVRKERERLNKIHTDMDAAVEKAIAEAEPDSTTRSRGKGGWKETPKVSNKKKDEIRKKIEADYIKKITNEAGSTPATIDTNVKSTTTDVPGPSTKNKGGTTVLGGGQNQTQTTSGGGDGGSSSTPKFGSKDPNNLGTFSTQGMYNMVG